MSTKKRVAEFQLTKEEESFKEPISVASISNDQDATAQPAPVAEGFGFGMYSKTNPFTQVIANGVAATKNSEEPRTNKNEGSSESGAVIAADTAPTSGFGAYTNINPFAAIAAKMPSFASAASTNPAASFSFGSGEHSLGSSKQNLSSAQLSINLVPENTPSLMRASSDSAATSFGGSGSAPPNSLGRPSSFSSVPSDGSLFSSYTTKAPFAVVIPSPQTTSPKAQNPFSNPSPKHNPFVTIVESKDNIWSAASRSSSGNRTGSSENDALSESRSFPFPSLAVPGSSSGVSTATEKSPSTDALECKSVFGGQNKERRSSKEKDGDEEDAVAGDDEHAEEQVYGKVYPMPDNVTVVTGEENEECVIQVRAKLFRLSVPSDTDCSPKGADILEHSHSIPSSGSGIFTQLINDRVIDGSVTATAAATGTAETSALQGTASTETDTKTEDENPKVAEKKSKPIGEWIEVGIGPVRILKQRESCDFNRGDEHRKSTNKPEIITSKKRMVMRREDKKGGKGTKLLLNMLLEGYINVKKQGDRTFHITCIGGQQSSDTNPSQNLDPESVSLSTYMFQTKQPQEADRLFDAINSFVAQDRKETSLSATANV